MIEPEEALLYAVIHFHRAIAFTNLNNVHDFPEIAKAHLRYADSDIKVIYGAEMRYVDKAGKIPKGITILAKNQWGIKELYKIISSISTVGDSNFVMNEMGMAWYKIHYPLEFKNMSTETFQCRK